MVLRVVGLLGSFAMAACMSMEEAPAPGITALTPDHARPGAVVTVAGKYLCQQPQRSEDLDPVVCAHVGTVMFGAMPSTVMSYKDARVQVVVPALPSSRIDVLIMVAGRTSNRMAFVVD